MNKMNQKPIKQESSELSIISLNSEGSNQTDFFTKTSMGERAVTEEAYELWYSQAESLELRLVLTTLWESGCRIGEACMLHQDNIEGRILTARKNKEKHKCLNCGKVKASHSLKDNKTCGNYQKDIKPTFKDILMSERFYGLALEWFQLGNSLMLPFQPDYYRRMLKKINNNLTPKTFRAGMVCYYQQKGANDDILQALLAHDGKQNLKYYKENKSADAHDFKRKVFAGIDTRIQSQLSVSENTEIIRKVISDEIAKALSITTTPTQ